MLGQISSMRGEYEHAIACQQRALEAARTAGFPYLQVTALCALGSAYLDISKEYLTQTTEFHSQAMQMMEMPLGTVMGAMNWAEMGFCLLAAGDLDRARELFQKGLTISSAPQNLARPQLLVGSVFVALGQRNLDDAAKFVLEAREFAEERAMKHLYPLIGFADAQVSAARGEAEQALEQFIRAEELALEMQMRPLVWQARAGAALALSASGRDGEADVKRRAAQAMIDEIAGLFEDEKLRTMFVEGATKRLG